MWKYCLATFNPADLITRGMDAKAFISNQQYWNQGPSWLMKQTQEWPSVTETKLQDSTENYTESQSLSDNLASPQKSTNLLNAIDITKYSTLNKTLRVTALVIHFTTKLREKTKSNTVIAIYMKHARIILLQSVQQFYYGDILSQIKDKARQRVELERGLARTTADVTGMAHQRAWKQMYVLSLWNHVRKMVKPRWQSLWGMMILQL